MPVIPILGKWRREDHKFEGSLGAYGEGFKVRQGYMIPYH